MQTPSSSNDGDDENVEPANADAEKEKLLREIRELKCIMKQCEWSLQMQRFEDVERHVTEKLPSHNLGTTLTSGRMPNVEVDLQNDLYTFAGFRCVKFQRDEFVFNFTTTNEGQRDTHAIQVFVKDGKGSLGKWIMPMSTDMNDMLSKTPIDNSNNLNAFIKSCKHNVDCHAIRQEQFLSLKKHTSHMKHCVVQSDIGFKQISLELYGVHDNENDKYMNLIITLLYYFDKARPYKIVIDVTDKNKLSDDDRQRLKMCLKEFKISDLKTAFDKMLTQDSTFTWMRTNDSESSLELNDSTSEEDFLVQLQSDQKRSLRKLRKKRELRKKWNERKRQGNIENIVSSKDNQEDGHSKTKIKRAPSSRRVSIKKKKAEKATSISKQEKINKNLLEETTPLHKFKLKQTKLNFQTQEATNSNTNEISLFESNLRNRPNIDDGKHSKIPKLITSTPLHCNVKIRKLTFLSPTLETNSITSI